MGHYSTQIHDSYGREIRVSKKSAPTHTLSTMFVLIAVSTCLERIYFLSTLEEYIGDSIYALRTPKSAWSSRYTNMGLVR